MSPVVSVPSSAALWPRTRRPLGINFRLSGFGVSAVWMKSDRRWIDLFGRNATDFIFPCCVCCQILFEFEFACTNEIEGSESLPTGNEINLTCDSAVDGALY